MNRYRLLAVMVFIQAPFSFTYADTCPLNDSGLTITNAGGVGQPGLYVKFQGCYCSAPYGPSDDTGEVTLGACPAAASNAMTSPKSFSRLSPPVIRNSSLVADGVPALTVVVRNEDHDEQHKNAIASFIRSTSGTAILVALITGLFGTFIADLLQKRKFQHELALQDRYKQAEENRTRLAKDLESERDFVRSAFQLVGRCIAAGESLLAIAAPEFQSRTPGPRFQAAQEKLRLTFDETEEIWKAERYSTDLLINLHHAGRNEIQRIWGEIDSAIANYFEVCKHKYNEFRVSGSLVTKEQRAELKVQYIEIIVGALRRLTVEISLARQLP